MIYIYVGLAGMLGAICRYIISIAIHSNSDFPWATLFINLLGAYGLALLTSTLAQKMKLSTEATTAIGTGFIGSFTTFSAISVETVALFENGNIVFATIYIFASIVGGLFMSRLGFKLNKGAIQT